jgi:hypothetical protein
MNRHVGGSILPSSDAKVLQIKTGEHGVFQVRVLPELHTQFSLPELLPTLAPKR